jgi:hypothetical protein
MSQKELLTVEVNKKVLIDGKIIEEHNESLLLDYLNKGYKVLHSSKGITREDFVDRVEDFADIKSTIEQPFIVDQFLAREGDDIVKNKIDLLTSKNGTIKITFDGIGTIEKVMFSAGDTITYGDVMISVCTSKEVETEMIISNTTYILERSNIKL